MYRLLVPEIAAGLLQLIAARLVGDANLLQIARIAIRQICCAFDDFVQLRELVEDASGRGHLSVRFKRYLDY